MPLVIKIAIAVVALFVALTLLFEPILFGILYLIFATVVSVAIIINYFTTKNR